MTVSEACDRYWREVGKYTKSWQQNKWSTAWLCEHLGSKRQIHKISNDDVARLVDRRRDEPKDSAYRNKARQRGFAVRTPARVTNATVNRSVLEPLRRILKRAEELWQEPVQPIAWKKLRLKEPRCRTRFLSIDEERALFQHLPEQYHPIVAFALLSGFRARECCNLRWPDLLWEDEIITVRGKGDKADTIPLSDPIRHILLRIRPTRAFAGPVFVNPKGAAISYRAYYAAFKTAAARAGIEDLRVHDLRHTVGTRITRATGDIQKAQRLLRHESISTTMKYAHILVSDLRESMDRMSVVGSTTLLGFEASAKDDGCVAARQGTQS